MKNKPVFRIVGGDLRQLYAARALLADGPVFVHGFDTHAALPADVQPATAAAPAADVLILPTPCTTDGVSVHAPFAAERIPLADLPAQLAPGGIVLGGRVCAATQAVFSGCGVPVIDYFDREELSVLNAIPTAEGAIQLILEELPTTVFGLRCLVTGYGRIARVLTRLLVAMGAQVTVAARNPADRVWAMQGGCAAIPVTALETALPRAELVCNTVPALLLDEPLLRLLPPEALVLDLASRPGGVDVSAAGRLGVRTIWALSLPGKVAPVSAGEAIATTVRNLLAADAGGSAACHTCAS